MKTSVNPVISCNFRKATENDINIVVEIIHSAYTQIVQKLSRLPGAVIKTEEKVISALKNEGLFVIEIHQRIGGTFSVKLLSDITLKLYHFALLPEYQQKSIGKLVLTNFIDQIGEIYPEIRNIQVEVYFKTPKLISYYEALGFKRIGEKVIKEERILILNRSL